MEQHWAKIIEAIGEDLQRPGLRDTPKRAAKAFEFLTRGYGQSVDEVVNEALFPSDSSEMVLVQDVELYSLCEHHLLPFIGKCHVAYIPTGQVIGLSKVARLVDVFARRLQIQEALTTQIAETIMAVTEAEGVGVIRGTAYVHDDARRGEAEFGNEDLRHAGLIPHRTENPRRIPVTAATAALVVARYYLQ